jgi:hypothetical protein
VCACVVYALPATSFLIKAPPYLPTCLHTRGDCVLPACDHAGSLESLDWASLVEELRAYLEEVRAVHVADEPILFYTVDLQASREVAANLQVFTVPTIVLLEQYEEETLEYTLEKEEEEEEEKEEEEGEEVEKQKEEEKEVERVQKQSELECETHSEPESEMEQEDSVLRPTSQVNATQTEPGAESNTRLVYHTYQGPRDVSHLMRFVERSVLISRFTAGYMDWRVRLHSHNNNNTNNNCYYDAIHFLTHSHSHSHPHAHSL